MPDYDLDPAFEHQLERVLRSFADEAVGTYDAVETTQIAIRRVPRAGSPRRGLPGWVRPVLLAALLAVALAVVGVAGGLVKLPNLDLNPNPSFQPFSPLPATFLPTFGPPASAPPGSDAPTAVPASPGPGATGGPPTTSVPATAIPTGTPSGPPPTEPPATEPPTASPESPTSEPTPEPTLEPTLEPTAEPTAVAVASADQGDGHSCALGDDGRIFCWGTNDNGELGDGSTSNRFVADVPVVGIDDATSVSAGIRFTCATRADASAWCWGEDPGSDLSHSTPQRVNGVANAITVSAGGAHACALRQNGTVLCWGLGSLGQLGNGTFENNSGVPTPQLVVGIGDAVQIAAGWNHTCALIRDGTIECWGGNGDGATGYGQLGDGTFDNRAAPVEVVGISDAVEVAAGGWTTCAVIRGGSVQCWGYGERGGLGNGARANSPSPVDVSDISDARSVAVGQFHACAQRSGGMVACWGGIGWGGGASSSVPVSGGTIVGSVQLSTDQSLLLVDDAGQLREWRLGSDDGPSLVAVGP